MFCPVCHAEYREGFTRCADCDVALVVELRPEETPSSEEPILLWNGDDPVEYGVIATALQQAGIDFHERFSWFHYVEQFRQQRFVILVNARDAEAARQALASTLPSFPPNS